MCLEGAPRLQCERFPLRLTDKTERAAPRRTAAAGGLADGSRDMGSAPRAKVAPWNDPVIRGWVFQIVVVGLVGLLAWYLVSNTMDNLERQKIASRLPLSRPRGGLRDRRHDDPLLAGQHLRPGDLRRPVQHAQSVDPRHHHGDRPRHADRRRPAVATTGCWPGSANGTSRPSATCRCCSGCSCSTS